MSAEVRMNPVAAINYSMIPTLLVQVDDVRRRQIVRLLLRDAVWCEHAEHSHDGLRDDVFVAGSSVIEQGHEAEVHVQLLMAV